MSFDALSISAYIIGLVLVYIFCRIFIRPIRYLFKILAKSVFGGLVLSAINFVGGFAGIMVSVNPFTAFVSGVLGLPGIVLVVLLQYII